jgi:hypothetical protein
MVQVNKNQFAQQQASFNQAQFQSNQSQQQAPFQEQSAQNQAQFQSSQVPPPKGFFQIPEKFLQLLPLLPTFIEFMTGQKVPLMGGMEDILSGVQQIQFGLQQVRVSQQQILARLESLENNASNQLTSLSQQVASTNQAFRLMHQKETKSLEFNPRPQPELERNYEEPEY